MEKTKDKKIFSVRVLLYISLAVGAIAILSPVIWAIFCSLKRDVDLAPVPFRILPPVWDFANYVEAFVQARLGRCIINSSIVGVSAITTNLVFCAMTGYALSRLRFPGRDLLFIIILATMMIPLEASVIPIFLVVKHFPLAGGNDILGRGGTGFINSYVGLVLPHAVSVYGMFLFRQFFSNLPKDLEDAARIDGCSEWGIFWKIMLPLSKPVLATLGIFSFLWVWNDFMWPLVCIRKQEMKTVQLSLSVFQQQYSTNWPPLLAASLIICIPPLVVFVLFQRHFVKGIAFTGIKG